MAFKTPCFGPRVPRATNEYYSLNWLAQSICDRTPTDVRTSYLMAGVGVITAVFTLTSQTRFIVPTFIVRRIIGTGRQLHGPAQPPQRRVAAHGLDPRIARPWAAPAHPAALSDISAIFIPLTYIFPGYR